jgi:hypothetical protein
MEYRSKGKKSHFGIIKMEARVRTQNIFHKLNFSRKLNILEPGSCYCLPLSTGYVGNYLLAAGC